MKIQVEFYGKLKSQFSQEPIDWQTDNSSVIEVYRELCEQLNQDVETRVIKPILNDTFCEWHQDIKEGDVIGLFPPASGG